MEYLINEFFNALKLIFSLNSEFIGIVLVSLKLSISSTVLASISGIPFGIFVAYKTRFPGRELIITFLNTCMSLPTVVVGLLVYSFISNRGPFGSFSLLFTQTAIIIGQFILIFPIVSSLTVSALKGLDKRVKKTVNSLGADPLQGFFMFVREARYGISAAVIASFGRVFAEVGISMMLGGNIRHYTRSITTAIALESSKGDFSMGIALGIILLSVSFAINIIFSRIQKTRGQFV